MLESNVCDYQCLLPEKKFGTNFSDYIYIIFEGSNIKTILIYCLRNSKFVNK